MIFRNLVKKNNLKQIKGVGDKITNCILFFRYKRANCALIDVWISRIIEKEYNGLNPFKDYPLLGGIMQQYMFYHVQQHKNR